MQQSPKQTRCNLCGSEQYTLLHREKKSPPVSAAEGFFFEKPEKVIRCLSCKIVYAIPKDSGPQSETLYADQLSAAVYLQEEAGLRSRARIILSQIGKFKRRGKMLEVGA